MLRRVVAAAGVAIGLLASCLLPSGSPWAQMSSIPAGASPGYYLVPSFSLMESYDDNIFFTSTRRQDDFVSRFQPGLRAGFQSEPLTLLGNYAFTSAIYATHPSLDTPTETQTGGLTVRYRPSEVLSLNFDGAYVETSIPALLNEPNLGLLVPPATLTTPNPSLPSNQTATGFQTTRVTSTYYSLVPSAAYRFDPVDRGTATFDYLHVEVGPIESTEQSGILQFDRELTAQDTGILKGAIRHFETAASPTAPTATFDSYVATVGWKRRLSEQLDATVDTGPRFTVGTGISNVLVDAEADAILNWRFPRGTASLGYARTELAVAGVAGVFRADSVYVSLDVEPIRFLRLFVSPRWTQATPVGAAAASSYTTYSIDTMATYRLTRWLTARLNYSYYILELAGAPDVPRNVVTIGLDVAYPWRVY